MDVAEVQTNREIVTLNGDSPTDNPEKLAAAWAAEHGYTLHKVQVLRVLEKSFTLQVSVSKAAPVVKPVAVAAATASGVDYGRDKLLTPFGLASLRDRYMLPHEKSPQDALMRAARAFADDEAHALRLYDYSSRLWFMFATPVLSNPPERHSWGATWEENFDAVHFDSKKRGMPISCFLNVAGDSRKGLTDHYAENAWLSSVGGGVGGYWGMVRSNGIKTKHGSASSGKLPFLKVVDSEVLAFAQGVTRRASYAAYTDISHPEIIEFLDMRKPTGGDPNRKCLNLHNAVNIPDAFMEIIERCMKDPDADDSWPLIDPHTKTVVETVSAKDLWQRILELRHQTGEPYIHFVDASNRALPESQKKLGLRVYQSNLCSEITLPTNEFRTAVCCLSSVNLELFDEWSKDPRFIGDLIRMLDNVLEFFIRNAGVRSPEDRAALEAEVRADLAEQGMSEEQLKAVVQYIEGKYHRAMAKAVYSASQERSVGLGAMGFHSYLQKNGIEFESALATSANRRMFSFMQRAASKETVKLAQERGACPDAGGDMRRNMHLMAIAPNASSSIICGGTSPGIEPHRANAFTQKTDNGSWLVKNKFLEEVLGQHGLNTEEVWQSIVLNKGSVQHLDFLSPHEKNVFKTAMELDQRWLIEHAAHRQEYICQAQSLNTFMPADVDRLYMHNVHFMAWKQGLKSLYYVRSEAIKRADTVSAKLSQEALKNTESVCLSCEG